MPKSKMLEYTLYGLTVVYSFIIAGTGMGDTGYVASYLGQRAVFYLVEVGLLIIAWIRCNKLHSDYDYDYFKKTEKIFAAADCCFVMIAIVTVFSVAVMIPIFLFLPKQVFDFGAANGLIVLLLITGLVFLFYTIVTKRFDIVKKQRGEMKHPLSERTEDFFAFIHSGDEKREETPDKKITDDTEILDDLVPDEYDFRKHLQRISEINAPAETKRQEQKPDSLHSLPSEPPEENLVPDEKDFWRHMQRISEVNAPAGSEQQPQRPNPLHLLPSEPPEENLVPDEKDFWRHMQRISEVNAPAEPEQQEQQFRECPICGSVNPMSIEQCGFCGTDLD